MDGAEHVGGIMPRPLFTHERASERDLSEQVMALWDSAAWLAAEGGDELARMLCASGCGRCITGMNWRRARGRRSRSVSRWQWASDGCWARISPAPWPRGTTSPAPAWPWVGRAESGPARGV